MSSGYTGMVFQRSFNIKKKLFRKKYVVEMNEVCGWETYDLITTKDRTTTIKTFISLSKAEQFQKEITLVEKDSNVKSIKELIDSTELRIKN